MSVQVENLEKNMVKLTIEVAEDKVAEALKASYEKQKNRISVPGFRKGKVPMAMIEKMYGPEIFYEEAANIMMQEAYPAAVDESGVDIVSQPTVDVVQLEKGKPFIFTAEVAKKPEVKLGKYTGVTVTKIDTAVSDEEVMEALERERSNNARTVTVEDRAIAQGDTAVIDFEGFVDDVAFEGGKGENYALEIGSHSFIDTFEDQLVGKNTGDELDVNVTFPEEYHAEDLAGKPAVFKVKIHEIKAKELPELNDEFASDVSEFETLEEYKESVRKNLQETKENNARRAKEDEAIKKIVEKSEMDIPDAMIDMQVQNMIQEFAQRLAQQGLSIDQYMQFSGMTVDKMKEQLRPEAVVRIQSSLVLEQIVKEENIEVTEEEINAQLDKMAAAYGMEADKLKEFMGETEKESVKQDVAIEKAVNFILDNAKERAKAKSKKEKEAEDASVE
ncbi:MAG: trigger factor [Lachnospiraceae bacterium]|nr:trigger factor [Lachnospiraceae bacterium]